VNIVSSLAIELLGDMALPLLEAFLSPLDSRETLQQIEKLAEILIGVFCDRSSTAEFHSLALQMIIGILTGLVIDCNITDHTTMLLIAILGNGDRDFRTFLLDAGILQILLRFCHASISSLLIVILRADEAIDGALVARLLELLLHGSTVERESLRLLILSAAARFPGTIALELMVNVSRFGN
jgi:hypothetical protein